MQEILACLYIAWADSIAWPIAIQPVCTLISLQVNNFTASFSDGRALCYLVHHYQPWLLPASDIQQLTTLTCQNSDADYFGGDNDEDDDSCDGNMIAASRFAGMCYGIRKKLKK